MKNIKKKISALMLITAFSTMQAGIAAETGLGVGLGGADLLTPVSSNGLVDVALVENAQGNIEQAHLFFNNDTHVEWNTLNVGANEQLFFNATNPSANLTILNTVQNGMSKIYGHVSANHGIGKLIISNPNGVLFDGAHFSTAGDALITTQPMTAIYTDGVMKAVNKATTDAVGVVNIQNSTFTSGGSINILAPSVDVVKSYMGAENGVKFVTANGQDYLATGNSAPTSAVRLEAVNINGDVFVVSDKGVVKTVNGGKIKGNLNIQSDDNVALNYVNNGETLQVTGNVNANGNGYLMYARNAKVDGNLNMENGGGFLEVKDVQVGKDMNLTTTAKSENTQGYKHFVHVIGDTTVGGNAVIESKDNIHIGNYRMGQKEVADGCCGTRVVDDYASSELLPGSFTVGGNLKAHAKDGHVMTTVDVKAKTIDFASDNLNVLTSENALLTADEYKFSSNGYIGAIKDYTKEDGTVVPGTGQIVTLMETYTGIPKDIKSHAYTKIAGGTISQINTPQNSEVYIASNNNVKLTGANAYNINLTAPGKRIDIEGNKVHANNINIGPETDYLKVEFPSRDYTLNYTNIRDEKVVTLRPDEEVTYELTDGTNGYNQPTLKPGNKTTYLIGPDKKPEPTPPGPTPPPGPNPPEPTPPGPVVPQGDEAAKNLMTQWTPEDIMQAPVNTPVAFAADLDDDENGTPIRKNVDGSVTVVRAFAVGK